MHARLPGFLHAPVLMHCLHCCFDDLQSLDQGTYSALQEIEEWF
jgi:hypothetical protein